ncbi:hypothetical protein TPHA_0F02430 [Tetrapisispora phaffii CBS 4417]|uniref:Protein kinase domain-containing protein n=1 Tax=Tetrapisispora phaffii (strain ATCC 24235 / CBS 4417 / NBRC 1672 / NRRL Y-8282 / UCD 70-5) TaxID=1071381 RepID=G8BUD8_TETPH|nr:hypothetical protein TPHA_0F02430 [Tetrapisispora phaffii CBS 4417]CCE63724.1 hypothetical protein TPHA_0F02430 [Tetrapisispora phaffii CBS 4417]
MVLAPLQVVTDNQKVNRIENFKKSNNNNYINEDYINIKNTSKISYNENDVVQVINKKDNLIKQNNEKLNRKKEKTNLLCKTPPSVIKDNSKKYFRRECLGEGGFARCFHIKDDVGISFACKIVSKKSIKTERTKFKLLSEIQIHQNLRYSHIVKFMDCFEDELNVYILLELCPNGSLMDLLKKRKILTEAEVKFMTTQVCGAINYMHSNNIIHRDLKLGNVFFDKNFNIKIGDFGLAATLSNVSEKKYTMCGTPNYIAPEVILSKQIGHSFEADIWSLGIMIYAMVLGKPPFQAKDVTTIYEKIKLCQYEFPPDKYITNDVKVLIQDLLVLDPSQRPRIMDILKYNWFKHSFPPKLPSTIFTEVPLYFIELSTLNSLKHFKNCLISCQLIVDLSKNNKTPFHNVFLNERQNIKNNPINTNLTNNNDVLQFCDTSFNSNNNNQVRKSEKIRKMNELNDDIRTNVLNPIGTTNLIKSRNAIKILNKACLDTLTTLLKIEQYNYNIKLDEIEQDEWATQKMPIIITKWVDLTTSSIKSSIFHNPKATENCFIYQLSTEDIGVLKSNGTTILKLFDVPEYWLIETDFKVGWIAKHKQYNDNSKKNTNYNTTVSTSMTTSNSLNSNKDNLNDQNRMEARTEEINTKKNMVFVEKYEEYMNKNLTRVSTFVKQKYHKDDIFLRRFTRCKEFVMFELSDCGFQFNFKDHFKIVLSDNGHIISIITPKQDSFVLSTKHFLSVAKYLNANPKSTNLETVYLNTISYGSCSQQEVKNKLKKLKFNQLKILEKIEMIKNILNQKSHGTI